MNKHNYPPVPSDTRVHYHGCCNYCSGHYRVAWWRFRLDNPLIVECPHCHEQMELNKTVRVISKPIKR